MIRRHPLGVFFALAYLISWLLWAPLWLPALTGAAVLPALPMQHALGGLGPLCAALLVAEIEGEGRGARDLLRRMVAWRGRLPWVAVGLLGPLAVLGIAMLSVRLAGGDPVPPGYLAASGTGTNPADLASTFAYNLLWFGFGEEAGWRGFALPRLQGRHSALAATLMLTVGWALWHLPLFLYRPEYVEMGPAGTAGWLLSLATGAVLLTWLYNGSRGSLLVVALFHASTNVAFTSGLATGPATGVAGALIMAWGLGVLLLTGPRCLSRAGKVVPARGRPGTVFVECVGRGRARPESEGALE